MRHRRVRGGLAADELDERHQRHRVHEVHAEHPVRPLRGGAEHGDRDGRGVGGEDDLRRASSASSCAKSVRFASSVLEDGLDDEVGVGEDVGAVAVVIRRERWRRRSAAASLPFSTSFARLLSIAPRARSSAGPRASTSETSKPGLREHLGDAVAHGARADDSDACDRVSHGGSLSKRSAIRDPAIRDPRSAIRDPRSAIRDPLITHRGSRTAHRAPRKAHRALGQEPDPPDDAQQGADNFEHQFDAQVQPIGCLRAHGDPPRPAVAAAAHSAFVSGAGVS